MSKSLIGTVFLEIRSWVEQDLFWFFFCDWCYPFNKKSLVAGRWRLHYDLWVYIYNDEEAMIYVYHYAHFRHIDSGSQSANELLSLIIVLFSFSLMLNLWQSWYDLKSANVWLNYLAKFSQKLWGKFFKPAIHLSSNWRECEKMLAKWEKQ